MAKEDFCFTYYDGDAARDTTHMNRLERGAYHDLVISQRKFGHLSLDQVKKILGRDFEECWPAIELIMKVDTEGKFFIEWLEGSIQKMRAHSKKQRQNVTKRYQQSTNNLPNEQTVTPLENEDGSGNENENENSFGKFENLFFGNDPIIVRKEKVSHVTTGSKPETIDFTQPDVEGDEIIFPIDTQPMRDLWAKWKRYRWEQYGQRYGLMGEQADLKRLERMTYPEIHSTILTAIANKWKNLYPEHSKNKANGTAGTNKKQQHTSTVAQYVSDHYAAKLSGGRT